MLTMHRPLLWTFAGGCLTGAALIGFSSGADTVPNDTSPARKEMPHREPTVADVRDQDRNAAGVELSSPQGSREIGSASPKEEGSSVADVLSRLEAAYRREHAAVERAPAPPQAITTAAAAPAHEVSAQKETPVALAAPPAPPKSAPEADAPRARAPEAEAAPVLASRDEARPRDIHIGDVNRNTHVGNVVHGDVVQGDVVLVQQLAVLQYLQLFAAQPYGFTYASPPPGKATPTRAFKSTLTNPDNPWGFDFKPTPLTN